MDKWALLIIAAGAIWYLAIRKSKNAQAKQGAALVLGIGIGLLIGALWAVSIINSAIP